MIFVSFPPHSQPKKAHFSRRQTHSHLIPRADPLRNSHFSLKIIILTRKMPLFLSSQPSLCGKSAHPAPTHSFQKSLIQPPFRNPLLKPLFCCFFKYIFSHMHPSLMHPFYPRGYLLNYLIPISFSYHSQSFPGLSHIIPKINYFLMFFRI